MKLTTYLEKHSEIIQNMIGNCENLSVCEIISRLVRTDKPFTNEDYFNQETYFSVFVKKCLILIILILFIISFFKKKL